MLKPLNPATTIIAFDLHGVVSHVNYLQAIKIGLRNPLCIARLILYSFNPWFLHDVYKLWRSDAVAAAYLQLVEDKYPFLLSCIPFLINVGNAQTPDPKIIDLIKDLKNRGYEVHLFSNIGDIILDVFATQHPAVLPLFDAVYFTKKQNGYVGKPYDAAYIDYQKTCNPHNKTVIFIDNTKHNLLAAERHGMIGILYKNSKSLVSALK